MRPGRKFIGVPKFRMKPVSCASAAMVQNLKQLAVCVITSRLASHLSVVGAVMDGTHLNTSHAVSVRSTVNSIFRHKATLSPEPQPGCAVTRSPPPPFYALLSITIDPQGFGFGL